MRIGVIGAGKIGGAVGTLWARAGHEVLFSSRHPEALVALVQRAGPGASRGTIEDAASFGEALLVSVPYAALSELGLALALQLIGRVTLETGNPYAGRDGPLAEHVIRSGQGTGPFSARFLAGARVVRAFNTVPAATLASAAHRPPPRVGIPIAGDDRDAVELAAKLVLDAGFDPVVVGGLDEARRFDVGTDVYGEALTADEIAAAMGAVEDQPPEGPIA
jgi:8-hydroxy-5-deazaflavin:NADPH oxidoreductase